MEDKKTLARLKACKAHSTTPFETAALAIVVIINMAGSDIWVENASIASILIQLEAESLGLGSTWIQLRLRESATEPSEAAVRHELGSGLIN